MKIPLYEKVAYGMGSAGGMLASYVVVSYLTLFATDIVGINALTIGTVFLICEIFDAITDILVTHLADSTQTRWGKYRPWLLFTGVPLSICLVLLFWNPSFLHTESQKAIWLFVLYFLLSPVFMTGYSCPDYVLLSIITDDERERLHLGSARSVGESAAELFSGGFCMSIVLFFGGGDYTNIIGWRWMAVIFGAVSLICCLSCFFGVKERVSISNQDEQGNQLSLRKKFSILLHSRVFFKVLCINAGLILASVESVLFSYFCIHNLGHEEWMSMLLTVASLSSMLTALLLPHFGTYFSKKQIITIGGVSLLLAATVGAVMQSFWGCLAFVILKGFGYGICISCSGILWADTADYIADKTGIAIPGLVMASGSFVQKMLMGVCTFLGTVILTLGQYDESLPVQTAYTQAWIRYGITAALLTATLIMLVANYSLNEFQNNTRRIR